jgi:hypothetical protein
LEDQATGIRYVLLPDEKMKEYNALDPDDFVGKKPEDIALKFGKLLGSKMDMDLWKNKPLQKNVQQYFAVLNYRQAKTKIC